MTVTGTRLILCVKSVGELLLLLFFNNLGNIQPSSGGTHADFGGCEKELGGTHNQGEFNFLTGNNLVRFCRCHL